MHTQHKKNEKEPDLPQTLLDISIAFFFVLFLLKIEEKEELFTNFYIFFFLLSFLVYNRCVTQNVNLFFSYSYDSASKTRIYICCCLMFEPENFLVFPVQ
jgi:hypothetical protein